MRRNATALLVAVAIMGQVSVPEARVLPVSRAERAAQDMGRAFRALAEGDPREAQRIVSRLDRKQLNNQDYVLYVDAQSLSLLGRHRAARIRFGQLARSGGSRFREVARFRIADCLWEEGQYRSAQAAYRKLVRASPKHDSGPGDVGLAHFRIAESSARLGRMKPAVADFQKFLVRYPAHPMASRAAQRLRELAGPLAAELSALDRIKRARALTRSHLWHESIAELGMVGDEHPRAVIRQRDFWIAMTLFKMRRRYKDAAELFLSVYPELGSQAAEALFHSARALSRADFDKQAILRYQRVVREFPHTRWAAEAQFLSGWLEFNLGNYRDALPHLTEMRSRYKRSRWFLEATWFLGFCHYLLGEYDAAAPLFAELAKRPQKLTGGKGDYWNARALQGRGKVAAANERYRALVGRFPFSWYALLARARLSEANVEIGPFGLTPSSSDSGTAVDEQVDESLASDPLIRRADELIRAKLEVEAGVELRRGEKAFLKRNNRAAALAILMNRYGRASNFKRPWMLAVVYGGHRALNAPPDSQAAVWWRHGYPLAYRSLIEKWQHLGDNPSYYLQSIMRKESGFDAHTLSYADAIGLLQMIPATTRRVAAELGLEYTDDLLYDPELNIKTGSWYIGHLLSKFRGQIPLGAGSFNSGPRPVMRWLDKNGDRPTDEFVELVSYRQTREYMKKVTETYARYLYLYSKKEYRQPMVINRDYVKDALTY